MHLLCKHFAGSSKNQQFYTQGEKRIGSTSTHETTHTCVWSNILNNSQMSIKWRVSKPNEINLHSGIFFFYKETWGRALLHNGWSLKTLAKEPDVYEMPGQANPKGIKTSGYWEREGRIGENHYGIRFGESWWLKHSQLYRNYICTCMNTSKPLKYSL